MERNRWKEIEMERNRDGKKWIWKEMDMERNRDGKK
jgi:hypothetical protein